MRMNRTMRQLIETRMPEMVSATWSEITRNLSSKYPLPDALSKVLHSSFQQQDGCFFLSALLPGATTLSTEDFPDRTGYECFVNKLHIEDYAERDGIEIGLTFADHVIRRFQDKHPEECLRAILSVGGGNCVVRFHVIRPGEEWLAPNLEEYSEEGILVLQSRR